MAFSLYRPMQVGIWNVVLSATLIAGALAATVSSAFAEGFRIETKVYVGEEKEKSKQKPQPVSETTTLFLDGAVYDFLKNPDQTAVFRKPGGGKPGQFILLNDEHSILTKVSTEKVAGAMTKLRTWASRQKDPFLQFAANPTFDESFNDGKLILASHLENYSVATAPCQHADALGDYRNYLDWYAQLNTLLSPGSLPPDPRLRLNAALARHKVVPVKVELTRAGEEPRRAEHDFTWRLSQDDLKRIDDVRASLSSYREVKNDEFLRVTKPKDSAR